MLKKKILLSVSACVLALTAFSGDAKAMDNNHKKDTYVAFKTNLSMLENHIDKNVLGLSLAGGVKMDDFRTELEYTYRFDGDGKRRGNDYKLETMNLMINGYYDIPTHMAIKPYVNLGVGASRIRTKERLVDSDVNYRASWGGGVGMGYEITECLTFDMGYRFIDLGKDVRSNEFYGGIRYNF